MWQNILQADKLITGDVLKVSSHTPLCNHYAVVFHKNGIPYVTHCQKVDGKMGVQIQTLEEFEKERTIYKHFRNEITKKLTDKFIEDKANELKAYGFNFMEMNCEDFARRIVGCYIGLDDRVALGIIISLTIITVLVTIIAVMKSRR